MAAPTLSNSYHSTYDVTGTVSIANVNWASGDLILVVGACESATNTLNTPTASGLTFLPVATDNSANQCFGGLWYAISTATGTNVTVSSTVTGTGFHGTSVFVYTSHDGIGNWAIVNASAATTLSLNRGTANSAVVFILADFGANADVTVTSSPASGATQNVATNPSPGNRYTVFVINWTDQGAAGNASFGFSAGSSVSNMMIAVEIRGITASLKPTDGFCPARAA